MPSPPHGRHGSAYYVTVQSRYAATRESRPRPVRRHTIVRSGTSNPSSKVSQFFSTPRHSSPNTDSPNPDFFKLSDSDLPPLPHARRSLSAGSTSANVIRTSSQQSSFDFTLKSEVQLDDSNDRLAYEKSTAVAWTKVYERLVHVFARQNRTELNELKDLIKACDQKRTELRRLKRSEKLWTEWIRKTKSLETENEILDSLVALLDGLAGSSESENDISMCPSSEGLINQLRSFTEAQMSQSAKLILDGFPHHGEINLSEFTVNAQQLASEAPDELYRLEVLALSLEQIVDQLTSDDLPACLQRTEQLISNSKSFAFEASTQMERFEKALLDSFAST